MVVGAVVTGQAREITVVVDNVDRANRKRKAVKLATQRRHGMETRTILVVVEEERLVEEVDHEEEAVQEVEMMEMGIDREVVMLNIRTETLRAKKITL